MKIEMLAEVREANMAYLTMAQSLIRRDMTSAVAILGMSVEAAEIIEALTYSQKIAIASSDILLCRFGVSDEVVWNLLTGHPTPKTEAETTTKLLADILLAGRLAMAS